AGGVGQESFTETLVVRSGETLLFRMETDLPIDPDLVTWNMTGEMTEVCDGQGRCEAPSPDERERLRFEAEPYLPLHEPVEDVPLRPFIVPQSGTLHVRSSATGMPEQVFSVRKHQALLLKHRAGQGRTASFPVAKGEQLFFHAHGPVPWPFTVWNLAVELEVAGGDAGVTRIPLNVPRSITSEGGSNVKRSPFGGGFHGWRYGVWGGRPAREGQPEEAFDPSIFYSDASLDLGEGSDRDRFREGKNQLRDGESEMSRRSRLFMPLVPRRRGTKVMETVPGLKPAPAYVSQDGSAFIGKGTMQGGHKGALASGPGSTRTVDASFRIGKTARASTADSFAGGLGASLGPGSLSLNVSSGHTSQRMDVRDMNGDGIIDVVVSGQGGGNGVRVTHLRQRTVRDTVTAPGSHLSESSDLTVTVGMGLSSPVPQLSAGGRLKGLEGMYPTGFSLGAGVAATLSATDVDLVDVNGDGLADQVRRDKHRKAFRVRLNLGSRFATQEDLIPVAAWDVEGDFDPLVARLGVESPPDADEDEQQGEAGIMGALGSLASPDVVRRNVAVTLEGNLGLTIAEDYGVTANWSSSLNGTQVALVDVTGDGLPDYVRKSPGENAFR
ncbi:MAG TPA: hypothetical protein VLQ93_00930, partial [Myxococcaceae bacterium]|nr:hypothetical protein [Myxococcaceae bacterium]